MEIEATLCKLGDLKYISHLDLARLIQRSVRRSRLPVELSMGYTPHYRISYGKALKLGIETKDQKMVFNMSEEIKPLEFKKRLNDKLPEGIKVLECKKRY